MRKVKRWRYYCEFCKKSGGSGGHIARHEHGCTMNPNRVCGMCKLMELEQTPMAELVAVMPDASDHIHESHEACGAEYFEGSLSVEANTALPTLRDKANNCPACIMAAIRQAGIPVPMVTDFDFTKEKDGVWSDFNESQRQSDYPW